MSGVIEALCSALGTTEVTLEQGYGPVTVDVDAGVWARALRAASDAGATYLDFLTAYDLEGDGFAVLVHLSTPDAADHVLLRTRVSRTAPSLATATGVFRGAAWHERETAEMYGVEFVGHDGIEPLLLSPAAPHAPLRKDVVLVERPSRPWPGAKDPTDSGGKPRRKVLPPGVPADWPAGPGGVAP